jgi:hypothetical protein
MIAEMVANAIGCQRSWDSTLSTPAQAVFLTEAKGLR